MNSATDVRTESQHDGDTIVSLVIPADPRRFMIARSVVTAIAAQLALSIDAVEDARLAVTECCNLLCELGQPDYLRVQMWSDGSALVLEVSSIAPGTDGPIEPPTHTLSWVIVSSLAETGWRPTTAGPSITTRWPTLAGAGR